MADKKLNSLALAEAKANDIVRKAIERKSKLIEEAAAAAEKEAGVARERYQKEFDAKKYDITDEEKKQEVITKADIEQVYSLYGANAAHCVEFMLEKITKVDHRVSRNIKADFSGL
jgi:vacuolar-type H+-ATPase subunit H